MKDSCLNRKGFQWRACFNGMERYIKTQYGSMLQASGAPDKGNKGTTRCTRGLSQDHSTTNGLTDGRTSNFPFWDYR